MTNLAVAKTYAEEVAAGPREGAVLTRGDADLCRLALAEYELNLFSWRRRYGRLALGLCAGLAIGALATIGVERARAGEVRCERTVVDVSCSDGTRVEQSNVGTSFRRPGQRPVRCARTATGVACNDR